MPWKIVNLDYGDRSHLHLKDPNAPIHMRTFFADASVEIGLGSDEPETCPVRATVTNDDVVVRATRFEPRHIEILSSIFASLDLEPGERDAALLWMRDAMRAHAGRAPNLPGNVASFPPPRGWPYDLSDATLLESLTDREGVPHTRIAALLKEGRRRGICPPAEESRSPEVFRRAPRG